MCYSEFIKDIDYLTFADTFSSSSRMGGWRQVSTTMAQIPTGGNLKNFLAAVGQWPGLARGQHSSPNSSLSISNSPLPEHAKVVIAGAGLIGNSVAYHLAEMGCPDVVVIEKMEAGSSKYGSGMLGLFRPKHERKIVRDCIDLYQNLEKDGYDLGLEHCGSVNLATTSDRWTSLKRRASAYRPTGVECRLVNPDEIQELHPFINTDGIIGGVHLPEDACVDAGKVSKVLAWKASQKGVKFVSGCGVREVITKKNQPTSGDTLSPSPG